MTNRLKVDDVALALKESKGMVSVAARRLGVTRKTIYRYINTYERVAEARDDARAAMTDFTEGKLYEQISEGNITAIIFYLKTQGRNRGYVERFEQATEGQLKVVVEYADGPEAG